MGGQSQEAMDVALFYRRLERWSEAVEILRMVERDNHDLYGTPAEFYYTLAYCLKRANQPHADYLRKARAAATNIDRFPYREESEAVLLEAAQADPTDAVARYLLGCLLYHRERPAEAIRQWEAAVQADPRDFHSRRALGLANADAAQLEKAIDLNPAHVPTLNDLSGMYAKAGRFDEQLAVLRKALARSPQDDNLAEAVLAANLIKGRYDEAERLVATHRFAPRHRSYGLRDKYRFMRYGMGAAAFREGRYAEALKLFESAQKPPVELGVDDFASQTTPRLDYYLGRALEALGRTAEARQAYERAVQDTPDLTAENFFIVPALEKLGRAAEAAKLAARFEAFARGELEAKSPRRRAEARYLLALVRKQAGADAEARKLREEALALQPDYLPPRLDLL